MKKLMSLMCATSSAGMVQRTTRAVAALALLTIPALVDAAPDRRGQRNSGNSGPGKRIERSVPEPATLLLLGAAAGVAYGVRKLKSKRR